MIKRCVFLPALALVASTGIAVAAPPTASSTPSSSSAPPAKPAAAVAGKGTASPPANPAPVGAEKAAASPPAKPAPATDAPSEVITDAARFKAEQGLKLFDEKRWHDAYEAFRIAEELFHAPSLVMRMAYCQAELGHLIQARELYRRVAEERLASDAPPAYRTAQADARRELARLAKRIARVRIGVTGIAGVRANVKLDGVHAPLEPEAVEVDPGEHRFEARAPGAEIAEKKQRIAEGADLSVTLRLEPLREKVVVVTRPVGLAPGVVTLSAGLAALIAGGVTGGIALAESRDLEERCGGFTCPTDALADRDRANVFATVSTASLVAGGVSVAASALLLPLHFAGGSASGGGDKPRVSLGLGPVGGEVVMRW